MFNRINYEEWTVIFPIVSFFVTFGIFGVAAWWAFTLKRRRVTHLANIPLVDGDDAPAAPERPRKCCGGKGHGHGGHGAHTCCCGRKASLNDIPQGSARNGAPPTPLSAHE